MIFYFVLLAYDAVLKGMQMLPFWRYYIASKSSELMTKWHRIIPQNKKSYSTLMWKSQN